MHLVQTGQPVYYAVDVGKPRDQWRFREIIRATPTNYTWLNRSGMTITLGYDSIPVELQKLDDGKAYLCHQHATLTKAIPVTTNCLDREQ